MTELEILLAIAGAIVTGMVVVGMILITPGGQVPVEGEHHRDGRVNGGVSSDGRGRPAAAGRDVPRR